MEIRFSDMTQEQDQAKVASLKQQYPHLGISIGGMVDFMIDDRD